MSVIFIFVFRLNVFWFYVPPMEKMMFCRVEKTAYCECLCVHIFSKGKVSFRILQVFSGLNAAFFFFLSFLCFYS